MYDRIIVGAGLYGLYAAELCGRRGERVLVLEYENAPFKRATYINQARVHMGYHYPRSLSTAVKSAHYFERFYKDYNFCILDQFDQVYATSEAFSWTNAGAFKKFCEAAAIPCEEINVNKYFKTGMCDGAFLTKEYTYDAHILKEYLLNEISKYNNVEIRYCVRIQEIECDGTIYEIMLDNGESLKTGFILNATYASVNQVNLLAGFEAFKLKYELCEIILCSVNNRLEKTGITVMDGPFFSIMPFGKTGFHSLTSVCFTPHVTSYDKIPKFGCQKNVEKSFCSYDNLGNCNECLNKPQSAWPYMSSLAKKYLNDDYQFKYEKSLFSMKPILKASEVDDSRPTMIREFTNQPTFVSVLSGKINTVYDLDEVLK